MIDKKLIITALLLPVTILLSGAALAAERTNNIPEAGIPIVYPLEAETCVEIPIEIELSASDSQNDIVLYQLTEQPRYGQAWIENQMLHYVPAKKVGKDKFSYTVVDADGNTAQPAQITVVIKKNRAGLTYADMRNNPAHYAAICLAEHNIMMGEKISDCAFFRPAQQITRSEFITMAATIAELPLEETQQTDFADDSGLSFWAKPFVSTAAANGLISGYQTTNGLAEIRGENPITLAEASVVINNLLSSSVSGVQYTAVTEHSNHLDWAQHAVSTMAKLDVLPTIADMQEKNDPITRQTACEMLYRAMHLMKK